MRGRNRRRREESEDVTLLEIDNMDELLTHEVQLEDISSVFEVLKKPDGVKPELLVCVSATVISLTTIYQLHKFEYAKDSILNIYYIVFFSASFITSTLSYTDSLVGFVVFIVLKKELNSNLPNKKLCFPQKEIRFSEKPSKLFQKYIKKIALHLEEYKPKHVSNEKPNNSNSRQEWRVELSPRIIIGVLRKKKGKDVEQASSIEERSVLFLCVPKEENVLKDDSNSKIRTTCLPKKTKWERGVSSSWCVRIFVLLWPPLVAQNGSESESQEARANRNFLERERRQRRRQSQADRRQERRSTSMSKAKAKAKAKARARARAKVDIEG
ncbi:hypothetical protein HYC85_013471 [Camellia sinensis]|uniref:Uncharacterized protein n=1 Tax=Camellia sinensis TaxID=4442 RepID=A0A7J7H6N1_CAMSI|nr:hypothetical protein HYC85_013471 [Camellia sinensis]